MLATREQRSLAVHLHKSQSGHRAHWQRRQHVHHLNAVVVIIITGTVVTAVVVVVADISMIGVETAGVDAIVPYELGYLEVKSIESFDVISNSIL